MPVPSSSTPVLFRPPMLPTRQVLLLPPPPESRFGPPSAVRPSDLPDDVLLCIFEQLSRARDVAAVRGVCIGWRHLIDRTETIWRSLVFDLPRCASNAQQAETWYRKAADYGNSQAQVWEKRPFAKGSAGDMFSVRLFSDCSGLLMRALCGLCCPLLFLLLSQFMLALLYTYGYNGQQHTSPR